MNRRGPSSASATPWTGRGIGSTARRAAEIGVIAEHGHAAFEMAAHNADPSVDHELLGRFIGAAYDRCDYCRHALLTLVVEHVATIVRLVELACVAIHNPFGRLPMSMVDELAPGQAAAGFRRLTQVAMGGANAAMLDECTRMTPAQRRAAANAAADLLIGQLA